MQAKVKCSECGAEITNLNFTWGKKQWLFVLPIMLIGLYPMWRVMGPKGNYRDDLQVEILKKRVSGNNLEILGTIENVANTTWQSIKVDAEFFDSSGGFVDEETTYMSGSIEPGRKEHFKIKVYMDNEELLKEDVTMKLKVSDAQAKLF